MISPDIFIYATTAIFGAIIGSFLNVVILRLPVENSSIVFPPSHCPKCNTPINWFDNIPVISYLMLRGKCRNCHTSISMQYPVVEILTAMAATALVFRFGITPATLGYFIFVSSLMVIIWIDIHHQIIPDVISLPGIILGFLFSFINPFLSWQSSIIGILVGGGALFLIGELYYLLRKQVGMGGGDIKLLAMLGAFLGWQSLPFIIMVSSLTGAVCGIAIILVQKTGSQTKIPFGPYLASAALTYLFFMDEVGQLYSWYLTLGAPG